MRSLSIILCCCPLLTIPVQSARTRTHLAAKASQEAHELFHQELSAAEREAYNSYRKEIEEKFGNEYIEMYRGNSSKIFSCRYGFKGAAPTDKSEATFLAIGDWGKHYWLSSMHFNCKTGKLTGSRCNSWSESYAREEAAQANTAKYMTEHAKKIHPSAVINVGDNFYMSGVSSTYSGAWCSVFENMYSDASLQVPWLSVLGNHDYGGDCCDGCLFTYSLNKIHQLAAGCSQAQVDYDYEKDWQWPAKKKTRWVMPDRYYKKTFNFGTMKIDFFALDTNWADVTKMCGNNCPVGGCDKPQDCYNFFQKLWREEMAWLKKELPASDAHWKFVIGHHPPAWAPIREILQTMKDPRQRNIYFSGHVHQMRYDVEDDIDVIVTGAGGGFQWAGSGTQGTKYAGGFEYGFQTLSVNKERVDVVYISDQGRELYSMSIPHDPAKERRYGSTEGHTAPGEYCEDTNGNATSASGFGCGNWNKRFCGQADTSDFSSNTMCCACGGGEKKKEAASDQDALDR